MGWTATVRGSLGEAVIGARSSGWPSAKGAELGCSETRTRDKESRAAALASSHAEVSPHAAPAGRLRQAQRWEAAPGCRP